MDGLSIHPTCIHLHTEMRERNVEVVASSIGVNRKTNRETNRQIDGHSKKQKK